MADQIVVLNEGRVMQVGAPMALYNEPASRFVAEFIGAPKINVFDGTVTDEPGDATGVRLASGTTLHLPPHAIAPGTQVFLGLRPEALTVEAAPTDALPDNAIAATVDVVERLGAEALIHCSAQGHIVPIRAKAEGTTTLAPGAAVQLTMDAEAFHLFDTTGDRVPRRDA